jgi:hypothetical protein
MICPLTKLTLEAALSKLAAERWALREELTALSPEVPTAKEFREKMALAALNHHPWGGGQVMIPRPGRSRAFSLPEAGNSALRFEPQAYEA